MFYDIYLDEVFYLREEEANYNQIKPNIFAGLDEYNKKEISNFKNGKITILRKEKDLTKFINTGRNIFTNNEKLYYGKINDEASKKIRIVFPYDLKGFNLSLQTHNLKHILKKHGNPITEITRGQINVTNYDFSLIPSIISDFDYMEITHNNEHNNKSLKFTKTINNITYNLVVYISFKNYNIEIKTMYKQK